MDYFKLHGLPPISELISIGGNILLYEWNYENKKIEYYERVEIMEKYEFIIAHLLLAISFLKIDHDLLTTINKIHEKEMYYNNRYFIEKNNFPFSKIMYFYNFRKNKLKEYRRNTNVVYFDCGVYNDVDNTKLFYKCWNEFYEYIFGKSYEYFSIEDILKKLEKKDAEKPANYDELIKYIKIPKIDFKGVLNLLSTLDGNMNRFESEKIIINKNLTKQNNMCINIDFRSELLKEHKKLNDLFEALKQIRNDDYEYYIEENNEKKIFKWNGTKVLFAVLIMTYLEKHTEATDFWRLFDNAFDSKFRDSAKQYLNNLSDKLDKNLKKANEILEKVKKLKN
jgi:hypothetical protein